MSLTQVSFPGLGFEFTVNRVAFTIGDFPVYWYGILIGLGLLLGMMYALSRAKEVGIDGDRMVDVILIGAVAGIIGARLYYVAFTAPGEFTSIADIIDIRKGGVAFYGTVIFAVVAALIVCPLRKVKLFPMFDIAAMGFLIGQGIGRWGNYINQEAFGTNTTLPWGMTSSTVSGYLTANAASLAERGIVADPMLPVHPTFLYESLWCLLGFVLLHFYLNKRKFDGEVALIYVAWNGIARAVIEGLRTDSLYIGQLRVSQVLAIVGSVAAVAVIILVRSKQKRSGDPEYLMPWGHTEAAKVELAEIEEARNSRKKRGGESDTKQVKDTVDSKLAELEKSAAAAAEDNAVVAVAEDKTAADVGEAAAADEKDSKAKTAGSTASKEPDSGTNQAEKADATKTGAKKNDTAKANRGKKSAAATSAETKTAVDVGDAAASASKKNTAAVDSVKAADDAAVDAVAADAKAETKKAAKTSSKKKITSVDVKLTRAKSGAEKAKGVVDNAKDALEAAKDAADNVNGALEAAKDTVDEAAEDAVDDARYALEAAAKDVIDDVKEPLDKGQTNIDEGIGKYDDMSMDELLSKKTVYRADTKRGKKKR